MLTFLAMFMAATGTATALPQIKAVYETPTECLQAIAKLSRAPELKAPELEKLGIHFMCLSVQHTSV